MFAAMTASAQCPLYPPESIGIQARGENGCENRCPMGEVIDFALGTAAGRPIQSCDILEWTFGDGATSTSTGLDTVSHAFPITFRDQPYIVTARVTNSLGYATAPAVTLQFHGAGCTFPRPNTPDGAMTGTYVGNVSKCGPGFGKCAVGEQIAFTFQAPAISITPCDHYTVFWGDGTQVDRFAIDDPATPVTAKHFFATTGDFSVTAVIATDAPPPASMASPGVTDAVDSAPSVTVNVPVTPHGELPPPRRRAARH
jgi:hypothetical protein